MSMKISETFSPYSRGSLHLDNTVVHEIHNTWNSRFTRPQGTARLSNLKTGDRGNGARSGSCAIVEEVGHLWGRFDAKPVTVVFPVRPSICSAATKCSQAHSPHSGRFRLKVLSRSVHRKYPRKKDLPREIYYPRKFYVHGKQPK